MAQKRSMRWVWIALGVVALLFVAGILAFQFAARSLKADILRALGPESEVSDLHIGFTGIIISGIRVKAPRGWPADSTLRAERVVVLPDLRQLLSHHIYVTKVTVENGYISLVRPKEGGGLKLLPSMLADSKKAKAESTGRTANVQTVELDNCTIELFASNTNRSNRRRLRAWSHGWPRPRHEEPLRRLGNQAQSRAARRASPSRE